MIPYENCELYLSFLIYLITKILSHIVANRRVMSKQQTLTSIQEKQSEDEVIKWVPKKKHEVLKAKYKCLKKLFQIYDASVIGILPETYAEPYSYPAETKTRRKRSRRTKTDACAGTTEISNGDVTVQSEDTIPTVIKELQQASVTLIKKDGFTQDCKENVSVQSEKESVIKFAPYDKERRPTRFQCFLQRIFGLKPEVPYNTRGYASDNDIVCFERRRRRGLRFRRRRTKKTRSEMMLRDMKSPAILSYVQSVQRNCLMESTPRQCPISGCRMMFYGIINYNDHLNLCHFPERQYFCHYCHEGFIKEADKIMHENEHLGIAKLNANVELSNNVCQSRKIASVTQTDPGLSIPEEKLKKIVSFFDKITNPDDLITEIKKNQYSESNLQTIQPTATCDSEGSKTETLTLEKKSGKSSLSDEFEVSQSLSFSTIRCQLCGEQFDNRRQLSLHINVEHRTHERFSKFHSCAGIINTKPKKAYQPSECSEYSKSDTTSSDSKVEESLNGGPSTNIVYYTSLESLSKKSVVNTLVQKVRSGFCYKWEPGTQIIRV
ncbi:unnamed protein product [Leptosia nina]|uniref:C2H2-type domain-containing protein n=1 Tax=Leptosia nina TaxID=320188 RepID=A0AAV1JKT4_9NEOP